MFIDIAIGKFDDRERRSMLGNDGSAERSIILEEHGTEHSIPLSGNAWSIGLDRNPNRLRMDHGIPSDSYHVIRTCVRSAARRDDEFRVMDAMGVAAEWINRLHALLCLRSEQKKKKKKKIMHTSIRVCTCGPSGESVMSVNRDGFFIASMIYDPEEYTRFVGPISVAK